VHGQPLAIAADERANAIDARQSRVMRAIDAREGTNRNLTKLAPLRFMIIGRDRVGLARRGT
jgi:hypothetical protein